MYLKERKGVTRNESDVPVLCPIETTGSFVRTPFSSERITYMNCPLRLNPQVPKHPQATTLLHCQWILVGAHGTFSMITRRLRSLMDAEVVVVLRTCGSGSPTKMDDMLKFFIITNPWLPGNSQVVGLRGSSTQRDYTTIIPRPSGRDQHEQWVGIGYPFMGSWSTM